MLTSYVIIIGFCFYFFEGGKKVTSKKHLQIIVFIELFLHPFGLSGEAVGKAAELGML